MLQDEIGEIIYKRLNEGTDEDFSERTVLASIYGECTNDISFKTWKYFPKDIKIRDIMCMMELRRAVCRRLMKEKTKENKKTEDFLQFVILTIDRVLAKAQNEIDMSEDKLKEIYQDIISG